MHTLCSLFRWVSMMSAIQLTPIHTRALVCSLG
jgi:hypothetical protein